MKACLTIFLQCQAILGVLRNYVPLLFPSYYKHCSSGARATHMYRTIACTVMSGVSRYHQIAVSTS